MYGTQTSAFFIIFNKSFENDVKMYGTQTMIKLCQIHRLFENDVKMYGTQTMRVVQTYTGCLRMM